MYGPVADSRLQVASWMVGSLARPCLLVLPRQLAFDERTLLGHCRVSVFDLAHQTLPEAVRDQRLQAAAGERRYLLFPSFGYDARKPAAAKRASAWNASIDRIGPIELLHANGQQLVLVNYGSIELGSPRMRLYRLPN